MTCKDCRYFFVDDRESTYRRDKMYFCKRRSAHFPRNVKVGEQGRILPETPICEFFDIKK